MDLALYCPDYGYYETEADRIGRAGDFQTSVGVGTLFGELLSGCLAVWLGELRLQVEPFVLLEVGAHRGALAADILGYLEGHYPEVLGRTEYWIVEPSPRRKAWQQETLRGFAAHTRWLTDLPTNGIHGVIFSNELLDAMPVRRLGWDAASKRWYEFGVALNGDALVWTRLPDKIDWDAGVPKELLAALPDGFTTEICPRATDWWERAAGGLSQGWLLAFDYGLERMQFFTPERREGTLRSYSQHRMVGDVLASPGQQDITAQVNWSAVREAGERAGLRTVADDRQEKFLMDRLREIESGRIRFAPWNPKRIRQFQTLTHPEHFGRSFRVLAQRR